MFNEFHYHALTDDNDENWCGGTVNGYWSSAIDYKGDLYPCIRYMASSLNGRQEPLNIGNISTGYQTTEEEKNHVNLLSNITRRS
jgi:radical SAM protein with 4Fe4S-binding SPASM domain